MSSKTYFTISGIFMILYIISSIGVVGGVPEWVHQVCTVIFAGAVFLGIRQKKKENKTE